MDNLMLLPTGESEFRCPDSNQHKRDDDGLLPRLTFSVRWLQVTSSTLTMGFCSGGIRSPFAL
jgi:hypothetical protein